MGRTSGSEESQGSIGAQDAEQAVPQPSFPGYNLEAPTRTLALPKSLREVSALADVNATTVACLQDEKGNLYFVDFASRDPIRRAPFAGKGDYEGLARVGAVFYVMRSDGVMLELRKVDGEYEVAREFDLGVEHKEIESLCHDEPNKRLLFVPKSRPTGKSPGKNNRPVFAFDLAKRALAPDPLLVLSRKKITKQASALGFSLPERETKKGKRKVDYTLEFSAMGVHPVSGDYYFLCGPDRLLLAINPEGKFVASHVFAASELSQPEGITFKANGDMLISSEGGKDPAVLVVFAYQQLKDPK